MTRFWTCRKCRHKNPRRKQKCEAMIPVRDGLGFTIDEEPCTGRRPAPRKPKHAAVLEEPYETWVAQFGEVCNICGRPATAARKLDRDHDHRSGKKRGLLCHICNRTLGNRIDVEWLEKATDYLRRAA
jgi:hypothetical protein